MAIYDIFNGDADGICALQQLRLVDPRASALVTGCKREIELLARIEPAAGDEITVLDVAMAANIGPLTRALECGATVRYFDHHFAGSIPEHPNLGSFIDTAPDVCTSLIVDRYLAGRQRAWAVVAAFGDNLGHAARAAAAPLDLSLPRLDLLRDLGELINYNAYGESVDDLHFHPAALYRSLSHYADPFEYIAVEPAFRQLEQGYRADLDAAAKVAPELQTPSSALYVLPDASWGRRISGSLGNRLARSHPERAHAVLTRSRDGYLVSVRAPMARPTGADELCRQFATGGGRAGAAGINRLAEADLDKFSAAFQRQFAPR